MDDDLKNRLDKINILIKKGCTCDTETGKVYNKSGKEIKSKTQKGYLKIAGSVNKKKFVIFQHQFIFYIATGKVVDIIDHKNGIKTDNRFANLRESDIIENSRNQKNAKGYYWNKTMNKWQAYITINKKSIKLGYYDNEIDAHNQYLKAKAFFHNEPYI